MVSKKLLNKHLVMEEFTDSLNEVVDDFFVRLTNVRDSQGPSALANMLPNELYKWAFECM